MGNYLAPQFFPELLLSRQGSLAQWQSICLWKVQYVPSLREKEQGNTVSPLHI